jgi:hypothetical protein
MKFPKTPLILSLLITGLTTLGARAQSGDAKPAAAAVQPANVPPDPASLRTLIELARSDLKTRKAILIAENLPLTAGEASEFWPVHRDY